MTAATATLPALPLADELPALAPPRAAWSSWLLRGVSLALLVAVIVEIVTARPNLSDLSLPASPLFWAAIAILYFALPAADWLIFHRLWRLPAAGFAVLLRKRISNEMLVAYSGEAYFYLWARRNAGLTTAPFGAIKDVAILSAFAANLATLALAGFALPFLNQLALGQYAAATMVSIGAMIALSAVPLLFARRLFTLPRRTLAWITGVHLARLMLTTAALGVAWHVAMPAAPLGLWLVLATLRLVVSRLPLLPSKDLLFATIAIFLIGHDSEVATLMATTGALMLAGHLLIGGALGVAGLLGRETRT